MTQAPSFRSRILGSLYGLPVGDALGAPYEFKVRGKYTVTSEMEVSYIFKDQGDALPAGTWTDDTSMALCLGKSLSEKGKLDWHDVADKWVRWYENGYMSAVGYCFDIGNTTREALDRYSLFNDLTTAFADGPPTKPGVDRDGNAPIMRLAPLPAFHSTRNPSPTKESTTSLLEQVALSARVTHGSPLSIDTARLMAVYLLGLYHSRLQTPQERKEEVLCAGFVAPGLSYEDMHFGTTETHEIWATANFKDLNKTTVSTSGFTVDTLQAALWALWNAQTFEEGLLAILPLGSDVDTVGAVYGQLAGACFGMESIPQRWLDKLQKREILDDVFLALAPTTDPQRRLLEDSK